MSLPTGLTDFCFGTESPKTLFQVQKKNQNTDPVNKDLNERPAICSKSGLTKSAVFILCRSYVFGSFHQKEEKQQTNNNYVFICVGSSFVLDHCTCVGLSGAWWGLMGHGCGVKFQKMLCFSLCCQIEPIETSNSKLRKDPS